MKGISVAMKHYEQYCFKYIPWLSSPGRQALAEFYQGISGKPQLYALSRCTRLQKSVHYTLNNTRNSVFTVKTASSFSLMLKQSCAKVFHVQ